MNDKTGSGEDASALDARSRALRRRLAGHRDVTPGGSPRELVVRRPFGSLYRYRSRTAEPNAAPLLIVYALVNRPSMMDLEANRSLIAALTGLGMDVYLIEWNEPGLEGRRWGLADYSGRFIDEFVAAVEAASGGPGINLLGVCQGGVFSLCFAARFPNRIRNLVTMVTPVDFHTTEDQLSAMVRRIDIAAVAGRAATVSGEWLNALFLALKPLSLGQKKYVDALFDLDRVEDEQTFMRMEQWIFDSPAVGRRITEEFVGAFYHANGFVNGTLQVGGAPLSLSAVKVPLLNVYATRDHLVPPPASRALAQLAGSSDYSECPVPAGHIGIYVSPTALGMVGARIAAWLAER